MLLLQRVEDSGPEASVLRAASELGVRVQCAHFFALFFLETSLELTDPLDAFTWVLFCFL